MAYCHFRLTTATYSSLFSGRYCPGLATAGVSKSNVQPLAIHLAIRRECRKLEKFCPSTPILVPNRRKTPYVRRSVQPFWLQGRGTSHHPECFRQTAHLRRAVWLRKV